MINNKIKNFNNNSFAGFGGYLDPTEYIKNSIDHSKEDRVERIKRYKTWKQNRNCR